MSDTSSMWADMLGIGPLLKTVADPAFQAQLRGFLEAMQQTLIVAQRTEAKVDLIARQLGVTFDGLDGGSLDGRSALPAGDGTAATRGPGLAARLGHDGAGAAAAPRAAARG